MGHIPKLTDAIFFSSGISLPQQWEPVFTSSGTELWQWELITDSGNALSILFPTRGSRDAAPVQTPPSPEWSSGSLPVSPSSLVVPSPIASPMTTPTSTILRLDALPPTLFEGYGTDLRELYTRSREAKDEFFSQCYMLMSLE
nr:hypothetical protein [Tanacetum cinerariifolium]